MAELKSRFEEIIHMTWKDFLVLEQGEGSNVDDSVICTLVRLCTDTDDVAASKMAFDRIDGLLETPIQVNVPKFYIRFVNAKEVEAGDSKQVTAGKKTTKETKYDPATAKLRDTLKEMRQMPKGIIGVVLGYKQAIEQGKTVDQDPMVKSIMVANLLKNVHEGKFRAIELVFDQIDGKLTRTITLLGGEDVYVDDYNTLVAPAGAVKDDDGHFIAENTTMTNAWLRGFAQSQKGLEILAEGLSDD